ncbi:MAG: hypothetical protein P8M22_13110 [Phycisphaerales bacterium]|nr:hypothetical protein [Phycisphaerales bacterium]
MTAKLMLILLGLGLTSLALLSLRQHRIDTAFEMTRLHDRCDQVRTSLWDIRCNIAQHIAQPKPIDPLEEEDDRQVATTLKAKPEETSGG